MQTPFGVWLPQVNILRCQRLDDAADVVDALRGRQCVVIQLEDAETLEAQRLVDFLAGATSALDGLMERIGEHTYLCAPSGVNVSRS